MASVRVRVAVGSILLHITARKLWKGYIFNLIPFICVLTKLNTFAHVKDKLFTNGRLQKVAYYKFVIKYVTQ